MNRTTAEREKLMEMNAYDYVLKKRIGYFAFRYLKYLEKDYPDAYDRFLNSSDYVEILLEF